MKNFFGVLLLILAVAVVMYFVWDRKIKRDVRYSKPLTTLVDHTFNPYANQKPAEDELKIREALRSSQKRVSSASKPSEMDQLTIRLCEALLEVRQKRAEFQARVSATRDKAYSSLTGSTGSEQTKKTIIDAMTKQYEQYEQERREYCQELLRRIKTAER